MTNHKIHTTANSKRQASVLFIYLALPAHVTEQPDQSILKAMGSSRYYKLSQRYFRGVYLITNLITKFLCTEQSSNGKRNIYIHAGTTIKFNQKPICA